MIWSLTPARFRRRKEDLGQQAIRSKPDARKDIWGKEKGSHTTKWQPAEVEQGREFYDSRKVNYGKGPSPLIKKESLWAPFRESPKFSRSPRSLAETWVRASVSHEHGAQWGKSGEDAFCFQRPCQACVDDLPFGWEMIGPGQFRASPPPGWSEHRPYKEAACGATAILQCHCHPPVPLPSSRRRVLIYVENAVSLFL